MKTAYFPHRKGIAAHCFHNIFESFVFAPLNFQIKKKISKSEKNDAFHTFRSAIFKDCSIYENNFEKL